MGWYETAGIGGGSDDLENPCSSNSRELQCGNRVLGLLDFMNIQEKLKSFFPN